MSDANYPSDVLLLNCEGAEGGAVFNDLSTGARVLTVTGVTTTLAQAKYGTSSAVFNGTSSYLELVSNYGFNFGTGDFTIEMWVRNDTSVNSRFLLDSRPTASNGTAYISLSTTSTNTVKFWTNAVDRIVGTTVLANGVWTHVALCRASGTTRLFVGGAVEGTYADTTSYAAGTSRPRIGSGGYSTPEAVFKGHICDVRITKGFARYTAAFTPPTSALTKTLSGIILDDAGNGCVRTVRAYPRDQGKPCIETVSSATGAYSINVPDVECSVLALDDSAGVIYNDLITRVTPV